MRRPSHLPLSPSHVSLAEGNPDEEKIGAFGVGQSRHYLYSIHFLMHGIYRLLQLVFGYRRAMGHLGRYANTTLTNSTRFDQVSYLHTPYPYLMPTKSSQLYARRGTIPAVDDAVDPWTTFQMTLREPGPIPQAFDFTRFLVSSITFMMHLSEVSVYFDDKRLVRLSKDCGVAKEVSMLKGLKGTGPKGMMSVKSIETMREFCCSFRKN